ncbi:MAG TPA: family 78 glycoside hydrolase catalytic domain [Bryobacteraceae bacterium]|jgi:alpha-L-rhamnosidase
MRPVLAVLLFLAAIGTIPLSAASVSVRVVDLRCEYRHNPLGIDEPQPRLSWRLEALSPSARDLKQSAYQIIVASSEKSAAAAQGDLWDTGRASGDQSTQIAYAGKPLSSTARVWWRVKVWDQAGQPTAWSEPATWSMGLLHPEDWKAKWIGKEQTEVWHDPNSPYSNLTHASWIEPATSVEAGDIFFRFTFDIPSGRTLTDAVAVLGGDRGGAFFLNGNSMGKIDRYGRPSIVPVTTALKPGRNVIAVQTSRMAHSQTPGLIGALKLTFSQGEPLILTTGAGWKSSAKPTPGWQQEDFSDSVWQAAKLNGAYGSAPWGWVGYSEERRLPARMLRKDFQAAGSLRRATVYLSGLGLSELYLNGAKVGDAVLSPGLTDYDKRDFYVTYDVTRQMKPGANAIGVILGNGRYYAPRAQEPIGMRSFGTPRLLLQMELEFADGRKQQIVSDETWKLTDRGPIRANNEFDGEDYDARMEIPGWASPGFNPANWQSAEVLTGPTGKLVAQMAEPLRVIETIHPVKFWETKPGVYIWDMGQNMVGWCRINMTGPAGAHVTLRHAETLNRDGKLYVDNLRSAAATDNYIVKGSKSEEVWEPRFTYHGFRFVEMTGYPGKPVLSALEGRVVHDAMEKTADFTSSNSLLNQLHKNIYWGVRGNYRSIPTDCPQRDERQGWMGDRSVVSWGESYLFNVAAFYNKWTQDIEDAQRPTGSIPDVVPTYWVLYNDGVTWPSTFLLAPNMVYRQYGDARIIEKHYPAMRQWVQYMEKFLDNGLMPKNTYGDWCVPPESPELIHSKDPARVTDPVLISTAYFYRMLLVLSDDARLVGKSGDAAQYTALAAKVKDAFIQHFFKSDTNQFDNGTQTSSVLPLAFDLVPTDRRQAVLDRLVKKIEVESDDHVGVGLIGAQWLMRTLTENGQGALALKIATQTTYPGWGYMIRKGATTIWELWNGDTADPAMNSGNHVMQIGDLNVWLYEDLAGIRSDKQAVGFKKIVIKPYAVKGLDNVAASHESPYGRIASKWVRNAGGIQMEVTIPPNTTATIYVPGKNAKESGGAKPDHAEGDATVFTIGSGSYTFTAS